jgi:tetratricopeptide (TPR) repeat protein
LRSVAWKLYKMTMMLTAVLSFLAAAWLSPLLLTEAYLVNPRVPTRAMTTKKSGRLHGSGHGLYSVAPQHRDLENLDSARLAFEELMKKTPVDLDPLPETLLTSASRYRRQLEIELLDSLHHSEEAVDELMHLWMYEHDADSAAQLEAMSAFCTPGLEEEERDLRQMIHEYPTWAEPCLRLAMLLYYKGRTDDAFDMAERAIVLKPWHFELYPIIIMLCLREDRMADAIRWARKALPPFRAGQENKRRHKWVSWAVETAQQRWQEAEEATHERLHQEGLVGEESWQ